ncbi:hypothetical protein [Marinifilum fragile]|uniref:hypothetical protein n=1 Tax=Marinifilum fragile TaxID=570161 RepID=UPI002AABA102|nr:hypothetical protein [Marinifilum fragile]
MKKIRSITKTDIGFFILLIAIATIAINSEIKRRNLKNNSSYTIGTTIKKSYSRWSTYIDYKYFANGKAFVSSHMIKNDNIKKNQMYYVIFQSDKPQNSRLLTDKPVIGHVDSIPVGGWNELPK